MSRRFASSLAAIVAVLVVAAISHGCWASAFSADLLGEGTLVAWLSGVDLEAAVTGIVRLTGDVATEGEPVSFEAEGTFRGFGVRGLVTLTTEGWIGYRAAGRTSRGDPVVIRGLLYIRWQSRVALQAGELLPGEQRAVVVLNGMSHAFCGGFSGTVDGGLEPSETPGTIQLYGTGVVRLDGEPGGGQTPIPLDHPSLPPEFLQYLAGLALPGS